MFKKLLPLSIFLLLISCSNQPKEANNPMKLWYNKPAEKWEEALPIGNGRLGAMIFGNPSTEHLHLNEETVWAGAPGGIMQGWYSSIVRWEATSDLKAGITGISRNAKKQPFMLSTKVMAPEGIQTKELDGHTFYQKKKQRNTNSKIYSVNAMTGTFNLNYTELL
jgi:hypothetical protein